MKDSIFQKWKVDLNLNFSANKVMVLRLLYALFDEIKRF